MPKVGPTRGTERERGIGELIDRIDEGLRQRLREIPALARIVSSGYIDEEDVEAPAHIAYLEKYSRFKELINSIGAHAPAERWRDAIGCEMIVPPIQDGFPSQVRRLFCLLRTFDQIDGRLPENEDVADLILEDMMDLTGMRKEVMEDFNQRRMVAEWQNVVQQVLQSFFQPDIANWEGGPEQSQEWLALYKARVEEFVLQEAASGLGRSRPMRPSVSLPRNIGHHLAHLACLFNNGAPMRLAASAEAPEILRDMILLFEAFTLLSATLHGGVQRELLLLKSRKGMWSSKLVKTLSQLVDSGDQQGVAQCQTALNQEVNSGQDEFDRPARYAGRHQTVHAQQCTNCEDAAGKVLPNFQTTNGCQGCVGPRLLDRVRMANSRHWVARPHLPDASGHVRTTHDLLYFDAGWGWEWPAHPIHSRGYNGRNCLMAAVQAGSDEATEMILNEFPDILATTYGGDTVLHIAARYDRDAIAVKLLCFATTPSALPVVKLSRGITVAGECHTELFATPLADIRVVLAGHEANLVNHYRKDQTSNEPYHDPCPCRAMRPQKLWEEEHGTVPNDADGFPFWCYANCHGLSAREELPVKRLILPGDDSFEGQLASTAASTTDLPVILQHLERERASEPTSEGRNHSLLNALAIFRDARNLIGRTALHSAAARDRDTVCKLLMALGSDPSSRDRWCFSALQLMVRNIPQAASMALDQYQLIDKAARKQMFFLRELECVGGSYNATIDGRRDLDGPEHHSRKFKGPYELIVPCIQKSDPRPPTLLQEITTNEDVTVSCIRHAVVKQMIRVKWFTFARAAHFYELCKYAVFVALWTAIALFEPLTYCIGDHNNSTCLDLGSGEESKYFRVHYFPFRIVLEAIAFLFALYYIQNERAEFRLENRIKDNQRKNAIAMLGPQPTGGFLNQYEYMSAKEYETELERIGDMQGKGFDVYWADSSNYIDVLTLVCLPLSSIFQVINVVVGGDYLVSQFAAWFLAVAVLMAWVNMLKFGRAYKEFGPFFVIIGSMLGDTILFLKLFLVFWVPTAAIFVLFFGGHAATDGQFGNFFMSMFNMYKLAMVDFDDSDITEVAPATARVLYIFWVFCSAVVLLNLFIAMMGTTFSNKYDEKLDVAAMEKAKVICNLEEKLCNRKRDSAFGLLGLLRGETLGHSMLQLKYAYSSTKHTDLIFTILEDRMAIDDWDDPDTEVNDVETTRRQILLSVDKVLEQNKELSGKMAEMSKEFIRASGPSSRQRSRGLPPVGGLSKFIPPSSYRGEVAL